jgi:hypothetical protein
MKHDKINNRSFDNFLFSIDKARDNQKTEN